MTDIPRSVIYLKMGKMISVHGGGVAVKSYVHIRDVSRGELAAMREARAGTIYHLSPEKGYAVGDVVGTICDLLGYEFKACTVTVGERLGQDAAYVIDSTRARQELGWIPKVSLQDGLAEVVGWVEDNWEQINRESLEYVHKS